jgi:hypothetical protein
MIVVLFGQSRMRASADQRRQRFPSRSKIDNRDIVQRSEVAIRDKLEGSPRDGKNRAGIAVYHLSPPTPMASGFAVGNTHFYPRVYESHIVRGEFHAARKT